MTTRWVILEESGKEQPRCKYCKTPLELFNNEFKEEFIIKRIILMMIPFLNYDPLTGNGWFHCHSCGRDFLIKDYANENTQNRDYTKQGGESNER